MNLTRIHHDTISIKLNNYKTTAKIIGIATLCVALLSGCATGVSHGPITTLNPNQTRLVIYRPSGIVGALETADVQVNGMPTCGLRNGAGFIKDVAPGQVTVSVDMWSDIGTSRLSWTAKSGATYYVRASSNLLKAGADVTFGLIGDGIYSATADNSGPLNLAFTQNAVGINPGVCTE